MSNRRSGSRRFLRSPNVVVQRQDPEVPAELGGLENCFDTVLCLNVLGYLNDPGAVVESLRATAHTEGLAAGDRADRVQFPSDPQSRRTEVTATWVSGRRVFTA